MLDPRLGRGGEGGAVPVEARADRVGGDEQQPVDARERGGELARVGEVGPPHVGAARGEIGQSRRAPAWSDDLPRVHGPQHEVGGGVAAGRRLL